MVNKDGLRPLRSRQQRAGVDLAGEGKASGGSAGDSAGPGSEVDEVRERAASMGYRLSREAKPRSFRPEADASGNVRTTCRLNPAVRKAMEVARLELNVSFSTIIERGVVMYLESEGLRV